MFDLRRLITVALLLIVGFMAQGQNLDVRLLDQLNNPNPLPGDPGWRFIDKTVTPLNVAVPVLIYSYASIRDDKELTTKAFQMALGVGLASGISSLMKVTIKRERPFSAYPDLIFQKAPVGPNSFPSGHTTSAFALATSFTMAFPHWYVAVPAYLYAGSVGYSRMRMGVHYPSDVLTGALIGVGSAYAGKKLHQWINKSKSNVKPN